MIRLNLWFPTSSIATAASQSRDDYFSIEACHNHNYDFFTTGIFGPGYESTFFETSDDLSQKRKGDVLTFDRTWSVALEPGSTLFVRKNREFHVQYNPTRFSISLNFVPKEAVDPADRQFLLCPDLRTIAKVVLPAVTPASQVGLRPSAVGAGR